MNIDWSKAPEGATHHAIGDWVYKWFKKIDEDTLDFWLGESWLRGVGTPAQTFAFYGEENIVARPEAWTGEGLPPVGTVCEFKFGECNGWEEGMIMCIGEIMVFVRQINISGETSEAGLRIDSLEFRPIRTAEQIAADDQSAQINRMINESLEGVAGVTIAQARTICSQLHKAGYRKQVQP